MEYSSEYEVEAKEIVYDERDIKDDDGIIAALDKNNMDIIVPKIKKLMD